MKTIHSRENRVLREMLKEIRESMGLTQKELAERLGRLQSFVSKYESGERRLDLVELRDISHCLGTDLPAVIAMFEARIG